jgi:perosamine synthetase
MTRLAPAGPTMAVTSESFIGFLEGVLGEAAHPVPLHEPRFAGHEWDYVRECLDTGWVSSVGKYVDDFERRLAELCGVRHAIAVVNGTAALQVALMMVGVRPGDEVLIPALTFVATANAVVHAGAVPHLVDSEIRTLGIDAARLDDYLDRIAERQAGVTVNRQTGRRIAAVVPMHTFGHPVDMDKLAEVARRWRLSIVEDATESIGSRYRGRPAGSLGDIAALSFNGNKIVTTGGGGAVVTDEPAIARHAKHVTTTAKLAHRWGFDHDEIGYNYRLPNINAALGCAQLEQLDGFLAAKRRLAGRYESACRGMSGFRFVKEPAEAASNYWLNAVLLDHADLPLRNRLLDAANDVGYHVRPVWTPMHRLPMFADAPRMDLAVTEDIVDRLINLPSSARHGLAEVA